MGPAWVQLGQVAMDRGDMVSAPGPPNGDLTELRHGWVQQKYGLDIHTIWSDLGATMRPQFTSLSLGLLFWTMEILSVVAETNTGRCSAQIVGA